MKKYTLSQIANILDGDLVGNGSVEVSGIKSLDEAGPEDLSFLSNPRYREELEGTGASGIIVARDIDIKDRNLIKVDDPYLGFAVVMELFHDEGYTGTGISPQASIHETARIGADPSIQPFAVVREGASVGDRTTLMSGVYVGPGAVVGDDCLIHPNVVLEHSVRIGNRVIVASGTVIGSDGFGFARDGSRHRKIHQAGIVEIGDNVEIGACCTIDRAVMGKTVIGDGTKLDNLIQVGHNSRIGKDCILVSFVGLAGSVTLEDNVTMAGRSGVVGHIKVGEGATILAASIVLNDIPPGASVAGFPAVDAMEWRKTSVLKRKLDSMRKRIRKLERELTSLKEGEK